MTFLLNPRKWPRKNLRYGLWFAFFTALCGIEVIVFGTVRYSIDPNFQRDMPFFIAGFVLIISAFITYKSVSVALHAIPLGEEELEEKELEEKKNTDMV